MKHTMLALVALSLPLTVLHPVQAASTLKTNFDGCTPERTMYFAYTADHTKAVEFCEIGSNYRYSYGPIDKPDTQITRKPGEIGIIQTEHGARFAVYKDGITHWTDIGRDGSDMLVVSKHNWSQGHRLSIIYLESGMGYVNNAEKGYKAYTY